VCHNGPPRVGERMRRLLLVSSSRVHGGGYLEHCQSRLRDLFAGCGRVLFVPWALADRDGYAATAREKLESLGFGVDSVHDAADPAAAVEAAEALFIGGGNTFRLLTELHRSGLIAPIRRRVRAGMPYMGTSAGSNVACPTLKTTNDMPIVQPPTFEALSLVPFQINAHYLDPDPASTHMGETRDTRLAEFHEENPTPVIGLREGSMLEVRGDAMTLLGDPGGKLFRRGRPPEPLSAGTRLDDLLRTD